ncbi:MAG TPA: MFS transporter [Candidatus Limnocylindrales bacterium]|nr:MFS transporter [Candidatus Limnocylindrales bacterium]
MSASPHDPLRSDDRTGKGILGHLRRLTVAQRYTFLACLLGWSLDAFDFFILVFCVSALATQFSAKVSDVAEAIFITLAMRPVGAFLFGFLADRFGRRPALLANVVCYSFFELASAFAPSLPAFLVIRALFGVAMGGEWGVGAALAFETLPAEGRGFFSGLLQEGYVIGYLLASLAYGLLFNLVGWRGMFVLGSLPALPVIYLILTRVKESPAWIQGRVARNAELHIGRDILSYTGSFIFLALLMFAFNLFSHGTQDLYPTFLQRNHGFLPGAVGLTAVVYNIGALLGGIVFGSWSEKIGRRKAIVLAALLSIPAIPLWAYGHTELTLIVGGFVMQFMVQGAWGVIPAHLNELSPPAVRATFPGFAYQVGNLLASRNSVIQAQLAERHFAGNYAPVLAGTVLIVATLVVIITSLGKEAKGADLSRAG